MTEHPSDHEARAELARLASEHGLDVDGGAIRRTSSRFCLGVEHGDYNGTELFGVGTDRFIWMAYKPNDSGVVRLVSGNFPADGVVEFRPGQVPESNDESIAKSWARFPFGVDYTLRRDGYRPDRGMDAVVFGNIPGGGMSRSASLTLNLILTAFEINGIEIEDDFRIIDLAQEVENNYVGSPCGQLDQIMIYFARAGQGTHYRPQDKSIQYVPIGDDATDFRLVSLDTGTVRPGLETSTYKVRRRECDQCVELIRGSMQIEQLADITDSAEFAQIEALLSGEHRHLLDRLTYIYRAQQRFASMLEAWRTGDIAAVGRVLRQDGVELRDLYDISGPELESMCDIARTVPGVLGERMLGGGDKGAAGAIVEADAVDPLRAAIDTAYPRSHPDYADSYAMHVCNVVDGVAKIDGI